MSPDPRPPSKPKPRMAIQTLSKWERDRKPSRARTDPMYIAFRAVRIPFSRIQPVGNEIPAWKNVHTLRIQKVLLVLQPCLAERTSSADPYAYSKTLMAIIATHGRYTMNLREWPRSSRSVSPTR